MALWGHCVVPLLGYFQDTNWPNTTLSHTMDASTMPIVWNMLRAHLTHIEHNIAVFQHTNMEKCWIISFQNLELEKFLFREIQLNLSGRRLYSSTSSVSVTLPNIDFRSCVMNIPSHPRIVYWLLTVTVAEVDSDQIYFPTKTSARKVISSTCASLNLDLDSVAFSRAFTG